MTTNILSDKWRGERAEPIDPAAVRFTVAPAKVYADCQGCMFIGQSSKVCMRAAEIAIEAGLLDCESPLPSGQSLVYVLDKSDPRQLDLVGMVEQGEASCA